MFTFVPLKHLIVYLRLHKVRNYQTVISLMFRRNITLGHRF